MVVAVVPSWFEPLWMEFAEYLFAAVVAAVAVVVGLVESFVVRLLKSQSNLSVADLRIVDFVERQWLLLLNLVLVVEL